MKKAWLITWEWVGDHAARQNKIVSVLNYRLSGETVRKFTEQLYIDLTSTLSEKIAYAKNKKNNPYPAQFNRINGVAFEGQINCGHNPHLYGRLVSNLSIEIDEDENEKLNWEEIPVPLFKKYSK